MFRKHRLSRRALIGAAAGLAGTSFAGHGATPDAVARGGTRPGFQLGVNLAGLEFGGSKLPGVANKDYAVPTAAELDYYRGKGLMLIRLPFRWERIQPAVGGELDSGHLSLLTAFASAAAARDMKIILDVHNYGRHLVAGRAELLASPALPVAAFADLWRRLAAAFAGHPGIGGYDLMNEPHDMGDRAAWPSAAQGAVDVIRAVDRETDIFVEGDHWSSAGTWTKYNNDLEIRDPTGNLVYSAHLYFDRDNSGTYKEDFARTGVTTQIGVERLTVFTDWLRARGYRGHVGEVGCPGDPEWLETLDKFLASARVANLLVTYWAGGPWWRNYPLSVEPSNSGDQPQMTVLAKYSGAKTRDLERPR